MFPGLLLQTLEWGVSLVKHWSDFKRFFYNHVFGCIYIFLRPLTEHTYLLIKCFARIIVKAKSEVPYYPPFLFYSWVFLSLFLSFLFACFLCTCLLSVCVLCFDRPVMGRGIIPLHPLSELPLCHSNHLFLLLCCQRMLTYIIPIFVLSLRVTLGSLRCARVVLACQSPPSRY